MSHFNRLLAALVAFAVFSTSLPLPAQAGLVGTDESLAPATTVGEQVSELLARQEVRAALVERGVDPAEVRARVGALTDEEARLVAAQIDRLPAGGSSVIGVLFAVFIILLITDILGLTKVFPFTRPVR
jgi:hypothetical protein